MSLAQKRAELETVKARASAIIEQYPAGGMPADKQTELGELKQRGFALAAEIKSERQVEEDKRDLNSLDDFLNRPEYRVPHGVGDGETDTHKALRTGGWEVKGGLIYAPTSLNKMQPMYPADVLIGDIPPDLTDEEKTFYRTSRRAFQPDYGDAYKSFLRLCGKMHDASMAWTMLKPEQQKALSEGTDSSGGFLVPPDAQAEMLVRVPQKAAVRGAGARVQPTGRDVLTWPLVQPASSTAGGLAAGGGSVFSSGFIGSWAGETPVFNDTDAAFGRFDVAVKKIRVATKLANDFIADAMVNPLTFLAQNGSDNMALVEDQGFLTGDGSALQPLGILSTPGIGTTTIEGTTANTVSNTTANAGSAPLIIDLEYSLPSQYIPGAKWMTRRAVEGHIRKLVDASGRFIWPGVLGSGFAMPAKEIDGYPVANSEFIPNDGTDLNKVLLFGDFGYYIIAQRAQITSTILRERFADTDQTGIILWERVGGAVWNIDAFRIGIM